MSANGDNTGNGNNCGDGSPTEKLTADDSAAVKTESYWNEVQCDVELSEQSAAEESVEQPLSVASCRPGSDQVEEKPSDDIRRSPSDEQSNGKSLEFGPFMGSSPNAFECQQCSSQLGTFEQFIKHMRTVHLQHCDGPTPSLLAKCQCHICGRHLVTNRVEFNMHLADHLLDSRTNWHCQKCHVKQFDRANDIREHLVQCHSHIIYRCAICLELFAERDDLADHLLTRHSVKEQKFHCLACEVPFESRVAFELHIGQVHAIDGHRRHSKRQHQQTNSPRGAEMKKESSNGGTASKSPKFVQFASSTVPPQNKGLKCVVCDVQCPDELSLDQHRLFEHCKVPHGDRCGVCRRPLDSLASFVNHSLAHRNPVNEEVHCVVCRQLVRGEVQLQMHGRYHLAALPSDREGTKNDANEDCAGQGDGLLEKDGDSVAEAEEQPRGHCSSPAADAGTPSTPDTVPTMQCPSCKMIMSSSEDYAKHLLLHVVVGSLADVGGGPFGDNGNGTFGDNDGGGDSSLQATQNRKSQLLMNCARCGRTFDTFVELNSHMLEHLRENIGGSGRKSRHEPLTHCQKEPIRCDKCKQTFASMGRFIVHRRRHKMERTLAKCRICDRRFANKAQLDEHTSAHSAKLQLLGR
uniref:C2H2-type domain-containing protein n=1 Tax=Globodera rostochiensis TaxID=31243 RepID=A0A914GWJ3_GLORO